MRARNLPRVVLLALLVTACSEAPTSPVDPQFSFVNGPGTLANVGRTPYGVQWISYHDPVSGLTLFTASRALVCELTPLQAVPVQDVGVLRDVVKRLQLGSVSLMVFSGNVTNPCPALPALATGTGRYVYVANDVYSAASRNNTWGWRVTGQVQGEDGTASVLGTFRYTSNNGVVGHTYSIKLTPAH